MENIIKKIFFKKIDESVHNDFVKYGRGNFKDKYLIDAKKQKDKWSIKTSAEFANYLVRRCLEKVSGEIEVKGIIVSTFDLREGMGGYVFDKNEEIKKAMGVKKMKVDSRIDVKRIKEVMERFPKAFYALSFSGKDFELKIKAKAPKSAKPSAGGEKEASADFCSLKTSDRGIVNDLIFDVPDFNEVSIKHEIVVNEIILPKGEKDPVKLRENSIRKGKIIRKIIIDGKETKKEADFEA
ncbi:MAG: hypothetical protein N3D20_02015 [Candidatus Pacearchaeota archaeon]|nr:hypothetical protein [Candidatus Pacearchaeota archaeon]